MKGVGGNVPNLSPNKVYFIDTTQNRRFISNQGPAEWEISCRVIFSSTEEFQDLRRTYTIAQPSPCSFPKAISISDSMSNSCSAPIQAFPLD